MTLEKFPEVGVVEWFVLYIDWWGYLNEINI